MAALNADSYYCHRCDREVLITGEVKCPSCNDGFIERIESDNSVESDEINDDNLSEGMNFFHIIHHIPSGSNSDTTDGSITVTTRDPENRNTMFGQLIQNLFGNLLPLDFRSDPSDYIFSEQSFDNIVTRIMNQFEQPGPPPARDEDLEKLPVKVISTAKDNDTCSICLSDYEVDEKVTELPCQHSYHQICVFSWLKKHGTCPICRKDLSGRDTVLLDNNGAEIVNNTSRSGSA